MNDTSTPRAEASSLLASLFFEVVCEEGIDFETFESRCISVGHSIMADAMSTALERFDARLCLDLPDGCKVHDRRKKSLASEVGDLCFKYRRVRDAFGNTVVLGEVVAAEMHGLELFEASHTVHDAVAPDGRLVQVKATQGSRVALTDEPDYLIVLKLRHDGTFDEVYNGPGGPAWAAAGKAQKTGQRHISLSKLAELDVSVPEGGRIH